MPMSSGISGLIRLGAALELEAEVNLETLSIEALGNCDYALETAGTFLLYRIALTGGEINVSASLIDSIDEPEHLLRVEDDETGWRTIFGLIASLERYRVPSLERPIRSGNPLYHDPATCWIIG